MPLPKFRPCVIPIDKDKRGMMTIQINIARAKAELSELIALAEAGEEVIIARDGIPVVTLTPRNPTPPTGPRAWDYGLTSAR